MQMCDLGFLEIAVDPVTVCVNHGDVGLARMGVIADPQKKVGDVAVHRTAHLGALQVDVGLGDLTLGRIEGRLRLGRGPT